MALRAGTPSSRRLYAVSPCRKGSKTAFRRRGFAPAGRARFTPTGFHRKRDETVPRSRAGRVTTDNLGDGLVQHHRLDLLTCVEPQRLARDLVRQALGGRASASQIDDAAVVACELVTNAIRHTPEGPVRMDLDVYEDTTVLWVHDGERNAEAVRVPEASTGDDQLESGRGLYLVEVLTEKWFVWSAGPGKAVVAVMPLGDRRCARTL